jgi:hypothetical protein
MAWDTDYIFEGLHMFGPPLNVWKWEIYQSPYGPESLSYYRLHLNIDDNEDLFQRLLHQTTDGSGIRYYQRLIMMHLNIPRPKEFFFYKAWIYSIEKNYRPSQYPYTEWKGPTLGIAFDKTKANSTAVQNLGRKG